MRLTIHTGFKVSPFELHHGRKPRTKLVNIFEKNKSYLSDWTTLNISVPLKQIPIYTARNKKREVTDHMIMAKKGKTPCCASHRSPERKPVKPVSRKFQYPYTYTENWNHTKLLEGKYKEQPTITVDGTKHTVRIADNSIFDRKLISTPTLIFRDHRRRFCPQPNTTWDDRE